MSNTPAPEPTTQPSLADLLKELAKLTAAPKDGTAPRFGFGSNKIPGHHHLSHPVGRVTEILRIIGEQAPAMLAQLGAQGK